MPISSLNHINLRTSKLEETRRFYVDVLGLRVGPRFSSNPPGYWIYCGEVPVVHVSEIAPGGEPKNNAAASGDGMDHVGFVGYDFAAMERRLTDSAMSYRKRVVFGGQLPQIFVEDPNGIVVEIGFPTEVEPVVVRDNTGEEELVQP